MGVKSSNVTGGSTNKEKKEIKQESKISITHN